MGVLKATSRLQGGRMDIKSINWPKVILTSLVIFCVVAVTATVSYLLLTQKKSQTDSSVLATVGDKKITKVDLNKAIYSRNFAGTPENPQNISATEKQQVLDGIIEKEIIRKNAKELGLTATDAEIKADITTGLESAPQAADGLKVYQSYSKTNQATTWDNSMINVLKAKVKEKVLAWNEGKFLLVRYDKYDASLPDGAKIDVPAADRTKLAKAQQDAAKLMADNLYQKLLSGTSYDVAESTLVNDKVVGMPGVLPQSPKMSGTITKANYFSEDGNQTITQFADFNNHISSIEKGKVSQPFQFKGNTGQSMQMYVVYVSTDQKTDGYKWGYKNWLSNQITEAKTNTLAKLIEKFTPKANAFGNDVCGTTGYGHAFCFQLNTYYSDRTNGTAVYLPNIPLSFDTGAANSPNGAINVNGSYHGFLNGGTDRRWATSSTDNGKLFFSYAASVAAPPREDYANDFVNCNYTATLRAWLTGGAPTIAGAVSGQGTWSWQYTGTDSGEYGTSAAVASSLRSYSTGSGAKVCLRRDWTGGCTDGVHTANGDSGTFYFKFFPVWQATVNVSVSPSGAGKLNGTGITNCTAACSAAVSPGNISMSETPVLQGYQFDHWEVRLNNGTVQTSVAPTYPSTPVTGNDILNMVANFKQSVTTNPSCTVSATPASGLAPLVVKAIVTPTDLGNVTYTYDLDFIGHPSTLVLPNRPATIYYTYANPGTYTIKVTASDGTQCSNQAQVTIKAPSSGSGGEVAP